MDYTTIDDIELAAYLKAKDRQAFDELYERYHLLLYRSAYLLLGNPYDVEDVLQETFLSAYLHIGDLREAAHLRAWLFRIMTNAAHKKGPKKEYPAEDILILSDKAGFSLEEDYMQVFLQDDIRRALWKLSQPQRLVIVLFYYDQLTIKEIARICRCFEGTVKSRLHKAKKILQKELETINPYTERKVELYAKHQ